MLTRLTFTRKSQVAIEFGYRFKIRYPHRWVFWVYAGSQTTIEQSFRSIAHAVGIPGRDGPIASIIQAIYDWLRYDAIDGWLIILDNVNEETMVGNIPKDVDIGRAGVAEDLPLPLTAYLPQTQHGFILITSRSVSIAFKLTGNYNNGIEVRPMLASESSALFSQKFKKYCDPDDVNQLVDILGHLPLAVTQAAAYLSARSPLLTIKGFVTGFQKYETQFLDSDLGDLRRDTAVSNSVTATFQMSIWMIGEKKASALRLFSLMCLFSPDDIPDYLVRDYTAGSIVDSKVESGDDDFEDDISTLKNFCLVAINNDEGDSFRIHRLVQITMKQWLESRGELEGWKQKYLMILSAAYPEDPDEDWTKCGAISMHAEAAIAYKPDDNRYLQYWIKILLDAAQYLEFRGSFDQAEEMNLRALREAEKMLGPDHPATLTALSSRVTILMRQGKQIEAEEMSRRAVAGRQKSLGIEHPLTLIALNNLACLMQERGKYMEAEELNVRALRGLETKLGTNHSKTLASMNNLGLSYQAQGKYDAAVEIHERALEGQKGLLGNEHPSTLSSAWNLARAYHAQSQYERASELYQVASAGFLRMLGPEHPDSQRCLQEYEVSLTRKGLVIPRSYRDHNLSFSGP